MVDTPPIIPPKVITPVTTTITSVGQQQNPPLWNFPQGAVLKGNVTAVNPDGTVKIETNAAQLLLRTQFPLAKNAQVSIRLEQPFTNDSMPHIRILTVNGTPALQVAQQQQAAAQAGTQVQNNPQLQTPVQSAAQAAELAKPVGVLLEIAARNTPANAKGAAEGVPVQNPNAANVRPTAAEVNLTPMQSLPAVLVRPSISPQALVLLPNLPLPAEVKAQVIQGEAGAGSSTNAMPVNAAQALLKPGLQLQVRLISTVLPQQNPAAVLPAGGAPLAPTPVPAHVTPAQTAGALPPAVNVPTGAPPLSTALPQAPLPPVATPLSDQQKAAYAAYAKQPAAFMTGGQTLPPVAGATPVLPAGQVPVSPQPTPQAHLLSSTAALPPVISPTAPAQISAAALPAGATLSPQVVDQLLSQVEAKTLPAGQMAAVVIGKEQSGALMVQTRLGLFSLPVAQADAVAPGTVITWDVRQVATTTPALTVEGGSGTPLAVAQAAQLTREGSPLQELVALLQNMPSPAAFHALQRIVPHAGANFTSGLFLFITMIRKGDVESWLGKDVVEQLEGLGKQDLLQRLSADIGTLRSLFNDTPQQQVIAGQQQAQQNWQPLFFPVMVGDNLHEAQLFTKQDGQKDKKKGGGGTRFVVELELSAFGPMQMDGLVKMRDNRTYFDLMIRTLKHLPDGVQADIYHIFDTAQKTTGMAGSLGFRHVAEFPVNPLEEIQQGEGGHEGSIMA